MGGKLKVRFWGGNAAKRTLPYAVLNFSFASYEHKLSVGYGAWAQLDIRCRREQPGFHPMKHERLVARGVTQFRPIAALVLAEANDAVSGVRKDRDVEFRMVFL